MRYAFARSAGDWLRFAGPSLFAAAALAALAPGASAGLPGVTDPVKLPAQLPLKDGAVGDLLPGDAVEGVVDDVVNEPLPAPVEDVVQNSPVAPVRDEVRRVVNEATGGRAAEVAARSGEGRGGSAPPAGTGAAPVRAGTAHAPGTAPAAPREGNAEAATAAPGRDRHSGLRRARRPAAAPRRR